MHWNLLVFLSPWNMTRTDLLSIIANGNWVLEGPDKEEPSISLYVGGSRERGAAESKRKNPWERAVRGGCVRGVKARTSNERVITERINGGAADLNVTKTHAQKDFFRDRNLPVCIPYMFNASVKHCTPCSNNFVFMHYARIMNVSYRVLWSVLCL